jgi:hypothetical protein
MDCTSLLQIKVIWTEGALACIVGYVKILYVLAAFFFVWVVRIWPCLLLSLVRGLESVCGFPGCLEGFACFAGCVFGLGASSCALVVPACLPGFLLCNKRVLFAAITHIQGCSCPAGH